MRKPFFASFPHIDLEGKVSTHRGGIVTPRETASSEELEETTEEPEVVLTNEREASIAMGRPRRVVRVPERYRD